MSDPDQSPLDETLDEMQDIIQHEVHRLANQVKGQMGGEGTYIHGVEKTMRTMAEALKVTIQCRAMADGQDGLSGLTDDEVTAKMLTDPAIVATLKLAGKG